VGNKLEQIRRDDDERSPAPARDVDNVRHRVSL
jgi:hypothetical protein